MGLTRIRAEQISDIDYKQATRAILLSNITLAGGAPAIVDGVSIAVNDRILVNGQTTGSQNGIYQVETLGTGSDGTWIRSTDTNVTGELEAGTIVMVTEGTTYADTQWKLTTNNPIIIGTTSLTFVINILSQLGGANTQIQYNNAGAMGASANLTWDGTTLYVNGTTSVTGNITGNYFLGNGSQLTGIDATAIQNGTSNVRVIASGNVTISSAGIPNVLTVTGTGSNIAGTLNSTGNANVGNLGTSGNITAGYLFGNGSQLTGIDSTAINNGTSNVRVNSSGGNATISIGGTPNVAVFTTTGANIAGTLNATGNANVGNIGATNVVATNLTGTVQTASQPNITSLGTLTGLTINNATTAITNGGTTGVGNIGALGATFNTVFAKATTAQYADLAENYSADKNYAIGTVLRFGGSNEVTESDSYHDTRIAGTVSENPAYLMNSGLASENTVAVALLGRVPCRVVGTIAKGDCLVASKIPGVATALAPESYQPGCIIGKALEEYTSDEPGTIEIVVGRL